MLPIALPVRGHDVADHLQRSAIWPKQNHLTNSVAQIEKIRREIVGGALPKELATGAEGLFVPGEARDRIWLKIR